MLNITDFLYEGGITSRLRVVRQIGELLQALNIQEWQGYGERDLCHIGELIEETITETLEAIREFSDLSSEENQKIKALIPPDPEEVAKKRAHDQELAISMAGMIEKTVPGVSDKIRELITQQNEEGEKNEDDQ